MCYCLSVTKCGLETLVDMTWGELLDEFHNRLSCTERIYYRAPYANPTNESKAWIPLNNNFVLNLWSDSVLVECVETLKVLRPSVPPASSYRS